ncbi:MAG TPA: hypothetical protein PKC24_11555 [Cyclobacteriaceae bacterium]|nr:hypothetical protein [Cyclobacteriaceae bacterium]
MRNAALYFILTSLLIGCSGSLSDEQRKQLKEQMQARKIQKISEGEIMEAALKQARTIIKQMAEEIDFSEAANTMELARLSEKYEVKISWVDDAIEIINEKEQQIYQAYQSMPADGRADDNLQKLGSEEFLYTTPVFTQQESEAMEFKGMWSITLSRRQVILSM